MSNWLEWWIDDRDNGDGYVVHDSFPEHYQGNLYHVIEKEAYDFLMEQHSTLRNCYNNVFDDREVRMAEIERIKNQRDWLFGILIGTVMALTFVIHVITLGTQK